MGGQGIRLLDGPMGTELLARGVPTPLPQWSAAALREAPGVVRAIHEAYAAAGANVHTANTFRTQPRWCPDDWRDLVRVAVGAARAAAGPGDLVAGSMAPLEDCYAPGLSPPDPAPEHRRLARALAEEGCDLILVETFPHVGEALVAVDEALATGLPCWLALTAGPDADLLDVDAMRVGFAEAVRLGASAVLVNCVPAAKTLGFLAATAGHGVPFGAYANAGRAEEGMGWTSDPLAPARYADLAATWVAAGATILGGCCGTGPAHVAALSARFSPRSGRSARSRRGPR
ncbi:MAG: homocysteine S-methyltransferase family protein [Planctomycetota bacterium]